MTNIDLRFSGSANFGSVRNEVTRLERDFESLEQKIKQTAVAANTAVNPKQYAATSAAVKQLQTDYSHALASSGQFVVEQRRMGDASDEFVNKLKKQQVGFRELMRQRELYSKAYRDQLRLERSTLTTFGTDMQGRTMATFAIPAEVSRSWDTGRAKLGMLGATMESVGKQGVNLGKNIQWAGRQLSVGFTIPAALTAASLGKLAFDLDASMASIEKVYDVAVDASMNAEQKAASRTAQINQLRADSLATATRAAKEYGSAMNDTLDVQSSFAAMGYSGRELQESTNEVMRLATLGEMDYQTSLQATIAMKEIYGLTTDQLSGKINYLNAVESGTILTMEDFATAIPIAGAAVNQLGGSIEDLGTMLTAMRARGIDANEGANAIKSAMTRIFRPSKQIQEEFNALTGESIVDLVESTNGELIPTFQKLGGVIEGLSNIDRTKVVAGLFGTYQNTRLSGLLQGVFQDINKEGTQTYKALEIASMSSTQQQAMAANELAVRMESASGRMKAAWESFKIEMAETGKVLLPIGNFLIDTANAAFNAFNNLPQGVKAAALVTAGIAAIAGPLIMLTGLAFNLTNQFVIGAGKIASFFGNLDVMTKKEKMNSLAVHDGTNALKGQTLAAEANAKAINTTAAALNSATAAQSRFVAAQAGAGRPGMNLRNEQADLSRVQQNAFVPLQSGPGMLGGIPVVPNQGNHRAMINATGAQAREQASILNSTTQTAVAQRQISAEQQKQAGMSPALQAGMASMALSSVAMVQPWSETVALLGQVAMLSTMVYPALKGARGALGAATNATAGWLSRLGTVEKSTGKIGSNVGGAAKIFGRGPGLINPWILGLAAAAGGSYLLYKHLKSSGDKVRELNRSAETMGKIFDFNTEMSSRVGNDGTPIDPLADKVKQIREDLPSLVEELRKVAGNEGEMFNIAQNQAIQAFNRGATEQQARDVAKAALQAAGKTVDEAEAIIIKFGLDLDSMEAQLGNLQKMMQGALGEATEGGFMFGSNPWGDYGKSGAEEATKQLVSSVEALRSSGELEKAAELMNSGLDIFDKKIMEARRRGFAVQADDMRDAMIKELAKTYDIDEKDFKGIMGGVNRLNMETLAGSNNDIGLVQLQRQQQVVEAINAIERQRDALNGSLNQKQRGILDSLIAGESIDSEHSKTLIDMINSNSDILNLLSARQTLGYQVYTSAVQTDNAVKRQVKSQEDVNSALREYLGLADGAAIGAEQLVQAQAKMGRDALEAGWSAVGEAMVSDLGAYFDTATDAAQARGEGAVDALAKRQEKAADRLERYWDRRQRALERERDMRDAMWDRELEMLERRKAEENSQYEYNKALWSGDLDEAANIAMNAEADARKAEIESQQQSEANYFDNAIQKVQNRAKQEQEALKKSQDAAKRSLDARIQNERRYAAKSTAINKQRLEAQLRADLAYTPATKAQAEKRIAMLTQKYSKYGLDLTNMSSRYGQTLNQSMMNSIITSANQLKTKIDWAGIADKAASDMVKKMWGTDLKTFLKWVEQNDIGPNKPKTSGIGSKDSKGNIQMPGGKTTKHGGGFIGDGKSNRRGYAASAAPMPSEMTVLAKKGEFMINDRAANALGPDVLHAMNNAHLYKDKGVGGPSLSQAMPASLAAAGMASVIAGLGAKAGRQGNSNGKTGALPEAGLAIGGSKNFGPGWHKPWNVKERNTNFGSTHDWLRLRNLLHTPIYAPHDGVAWGKDYPGYEPRQAHGGNGYRSYGRQAFIDTGEGVISFAHLSQRAVGPRKKVKAGDLLGYTGVTGNTSGHHTHVEWDGQLNFGPQMARRGITGLRKGGTIKYDDTLINAHKGETVLTQSLTDKFKEGVKRFGESDGAGTTNQFGDIIVNVNDSRDPEVGRKTALKIKKALDKETSRKTGVNRVG